MVLRRCPKCGTTGDDVYGFCIKCGFEFPEIPKGQNACPLCGYPNPDEADYCVKCGTPLLFKSQFEGNHTAINPIVIQREVIANPEGNRESRVHSIIIILGYIFTILGGLLGLIIAIYLSTRKNPIDKRHGHVQLAIFGFYLLLIAILLATGSITPDVFSNYSQLLSGNFTPLNR